MFLKLAISYLIMKNIPGTTDPRHPWAYPVVAYAISQLYQNFGSEQDWIKSKPLSKNNVDWIIKQVLSAFIKLSVLFVDRS